MPVKDFTMNKPIPISPMEAQTTKSLDDLQVQIRLRAFEIYERRGRENGHDVEDWLQAESEVVAASHSRAARSAGALLHARPYSI